MLKFLKFSSGILVLCLYSMIWISDTELEPWNTIHEESNGAINFSFKIKTNPNLAQNSWMSIEIENQTGEALRIVNAMYKVELQGINNKGRIVTEGYFRSENPSEIFNLPFSPNPFEEAKLSTGSIVESRRLSTLSASILGYNKSPQTIHGNLVFYLELEGNHRYVVSPENIAFRFDWLPMTAENISEVKQELNNLLRNPTGQSFENYRLTDLLSIPKIEKELEVQTLISGVGLRKNNRDGRQVIVEMISDHFSHNKAVKEYYVDHIKKQDYRILEDLKLHPELWSIENLPEMVSWVKSANNSTKYRLLETLNEKRESWIKSKETIGILSKLVEEKFDYLLKSRPELLNQRELVSWAAAAHMWSMTGNEKAIPYLVPFLKIKKSIIGRELLLDHNSYDFPRANRVCDVALEAILRVQGKDLAQTYRTAGYNPPYLYGEAPIIVEKIRNDLIRDFRI